MHWSCDCRIHYLRGKRLYLNCHTYGLIPNDDWRLRCGNCYLLPNDGHLLLLHVNGHYSYCVTRERSLCLCCGCGKNGQDALLRILYGLHESGDHGKQGGNDVRVGTNSNGDGDGKHSSGANTSHVTNNCVRTTIPGNNPNTTDYAMRTINRSRTSRILQVYRHIQAQ